MSCVREKGLPLGVTVKAIFEIGHFSTSSIKTEFDLPKDVAVDGLNFEFGGGSDGLIELRGEESVTLGSQLFAPAAKVRFPPTLHFSAPAPPSRQIQPIKVRDCFFRGDFNPLKEVTNAVI